MSETHVTDHPTPTSLPLLLLWRVSKGRYKCRASREVHRAHRPLVASLTTRAATLKRVAALAAGASLALGAFCFLLGMVSQSLAQAGMAFAAFCFLCCISAWRWLSSFGVADRFVADLDALLQRIPLAPSAAVEVDLAPRLQNGGWITRPWLKLRGTLAGGATFTYARTRRRTETGRRAVGARRVQVTYAITATDDVTIRSSPTAQFDGVSLASLLRVKLAGLGPRLKVEGRPGEVRLSVPVGMQPAQMPSESLPPVVELVSALLAAGLAPTPANLHQGAGHAGALRA